MHEPAPTSDAIVLGPFSLHARIGRGGMGEVWRAWHVSQRTPVAVKVLTAAGSGQAMFVESFGNEVRAAAALDHPNIATMLDFGMVSPSAAARSGGRFVAGTPYLSMELVEADTLAQHLGTLPWSAVEHLLLRLLEALSHAHARGVIHRDLKLTNVMYAPAEGTRPALIKLTDFGIAHAMASTSDPFRWERPRSCRPSSASAGGGTTVRGRICTASGAARMPCSPGGPRSRTPGWTTRKRPAGCPSFPPATTSRGSLRVAGHADRTPIRPTASPSRRMRHGPSMDCLGARRWPDRRFQRTGNAKPPSLRPHRCSAPAWACTRSVECP